MIKLILIPGLIMLSCGSTKSNQSAANKDSVTIVSAEESGNDTLNTTMYDVEKLPTCIKDKLDSFKVKEVHERPQKMIEYTYKGKKVYYVVMPCCDFFNEVYDDKCNYLGAPDGGFAGKGDGKIPDFTEQAKVVKTVWEASK
ncbi:MAG: hypothetical protein WBP16_01190 [Ferruginibacter sp.]